MSIQFPLVADGKLDAQQHAPRFKSVAGAGDAPLPIGTAVLSSEQVFSPLLLMKQSALENNLRQLADFCREQGVMLAAHGKTSMSPAILRRAITEGEPGDSVPPPRHRYARCVSLVFATSFSPISWSILPVSAGWVNGKNSIPTTVFSAT